MLTDYVIYDTETTGLDALNNDVIEIGAFKIKNGIVVEKFSSFCKPKMAIPKFITEINGITDEMVADAEPPAVVIPEFKAFCEDLPLLAYNLPFDFKFVCAVDDFTEPSDRYGLDVLTMARQILGGKTVNHKLGTVADYFHINIQIATKDNHNRNYHSALYDAMVTKRVYEELCSISTIDYKAEKLTNIYKDTVNKGGNRQNVQKLSYI